MSTTKTIFIWLAIVATASAQYESRSTVEPSQVYSAMRQRQAPAPCKHGILTPTPEVFVAPTTPVAVSMGRSMPSGGGMGGMGMGGMGGMGMGMMVMSVAQLQKFLGHGDPYNPKVVPQAADQSRSSSSSSSSSYGSSYSSPPPPPPPQQPPTPQAYTPTYTTSYAPSYSSPAPTPTKSSYGGYTARVPSYAAPVSQGQFLSSHGSVGFRQPGSGAPGSLSSPLTSTLGSQQPSSFGSRFPSGSQEQPLESPAGSQQPSSGSEFSSQQPSGSQFPSQQPSGSQFPSQQQFPESTFAPQQPGGSISSPLQQPQQPFESSPSSNFPSSSGQPSQQPSFESVSPVSQQLPTQTQGSRITVNFPSSVPVQQQSFPGGSIVSPLQSSALPSPQSTFPTGQQPAQGSTTSQPREEVPIMRFNEEIRPGVSHETNFLSGNGIQQQESTRIQPSSGPESEEITKTGSVTYTAPNGQVIRLSYVADKNGYRPVGDHLPTPPPIPMELIEAFRTAQMLGD